jgi:hypothetical protein
MLLYKWCDTFQGTWGRGTIQFYNLHAPFFYGDPLYGTQYQLGSPNFFFVCPMVGMPQGFAPIHLHIFLETSKMSLTVD